MKTSPTLAAALVLLAGSVFAAPQDTTQKPTATKLTEVYTCPITGEKVLGKGAGSEVVGNYNVHFCCGGCQPAFDKLTPRQKQAKISEIVKKTKGDAPKG